MQKHVNLVDLVKSFPTNIFLQILASVQKRTSPIKFAHLAEKSEKGSTSNLSTKVAVAAAVAAAAAAAALAIASVFHSGCGTTRRPGWGTRRTSAPRARSSLVEFTGATWRRTARLATPRNRPPSKMAFF